MIVVMLIIDDQGDRETRTETSRPTHPHPHLYVYGSPDADAHPLVPREEGFKASYCATLAMGAMAATPALHGACVGVCVWMLDGGDEMNA